MNKKTGIILSILASTGVTTCLLASPSFAQSNIYNVSGEARPEDTFKTQEGSDPFSTNSDNSSVFNLIHRAQMGNLRDMSDFNSEQRQSIQSAADKFRQQQLDRIRKNNQNQAAPTSQN